MDKYRYRVLLALGGLFHDVGKLLDRAGEKAEGKEGFGYAHAELSYKFIERVLKNKLSPDDYQKVLDSAFHHKPKNQEQKLYQVADINSSKERSQEQEDISDKAIKRLRPIFLGLEVDFFNSQLDKEYYIELNKLELTKNVLFPKEGTPVDKYADILKAFESELKKVDFSDLHKAFLKVYHLFYKYCWCVPASTYDRERGTRHYPDISLFDHSRMVSAIACALSTNKERFLLVDGDISGIQEFLFSLTNIKGVAKRLRGRSFFLSVLPHLVARALLKELEYPLCNLIYAGGGKFLALFGYEEGIEDKLRGFAKRVEEALIREFGGKLGFVLSWVDTREEGLSGEGFRETMKRLHERISLQKKRKFSLTMEVFEELAYGQGDGMCPSCMWGMVEEGKEVCKWCEVFLELGNALTKAKYIAFDTHMWLNRWGFYLEGIGGVYLLEEPEEDLEEVYLINHTDFLEKGADGFLFFANYVPKNEEGSTLDFERLSEKAKGDKKIAFARGDVDFLGLIFQSIKEYSLSRLATLSRSLDLFFSGYLNEFLKGSDIYTLYAGGDDFFLIGPWDQLVEKILELKVDFDKYTAYNPLLNFSVGFHIDRPEVPVRFAGEFAEVEEKSVKREKTRIISEGEKSEGLPHFSILNEILTQEELRDGIDNSKELEQFIKDGHIGRSTFYRIYTLMKYFRENRKEKWWKFYPLFYYQIHRNVKGGEREKFVKTLIETDKDYTVKRNALFMAKYVIMKTRGVSENNRE